MKREGESWRGDRERWGGRNRDNGGKREKDRSREGERKRGSETKRGSERKREAVSILTFTWSVGFGLVNHHVGHLNVLHRWRLEGGREGRQEVNKAILLFL